MGDERRMAQLAAKDVAERNLLLLERLRLSTEQPQEQPPLSQSPQRGSPNRPLAASSSREMGRNSPEKRDQSPASLHQPATASPSGSGLSSQGTSPSPPRRRQEDRPSSAHVAGCRCPTCNYISQFSSLFTVQYDSRCPPGCLCDFCLDERECRNEGHKLPEHKQCTSRWCICKNGCLVPGCPKCREPNMTNPRNPLLRHVAPRLGSSPSTPRGRGEGSGSRGQGEGRGSPGQSRGSPGQGRGRGSTGRGRGGTGRGDGSQGSGTHGPGHAAGVQPHMSNNRLRQRRPGSP